MSRLAYAAIQGTAPWHRKFLAIPEQKRLAAFGFWAATIAYCELHRNDGQLHDAHLVAIFPCNEAQRECIVGLLVDVGLFDRTDEGVDVHDYLEHNRSAAQIEAARQAMSEGGKNKPPRKPPKKPPKVPSEPTLPSPPERESQSSEEREELEPEKSELCGWCKGKGTEQEDGCPTCGAKEA
jgi:hypothetical protein